MYKNSEGYADETAGKAIKNVTDKEIIKLRHCDLTKAVTAICTLAGFDIIKIELRHRRTKQEFK